MKSPVVLVVVIVIAIAAIAFSVSKMGGPKVVDSTDDMEAQKGQVRPMKCMACNDTAQMTQNDAYKMQTGNGKYKCPKCGKFEFGFLLNDGKYGEYVAWEFDKPHPKRLTE